MVIVMIYHRAIKTRLDNTIDNIVTYKTGVINDLLGQTHNPASSDHYIHLEIVLFSKILTDDMCENSDHYRPWSWVGLVNQYIKKTSYITSSGNSE